MLCDGFLTDVEVFNTRTSNFLEDDFGPSFYDVTGQCTGDNGFENTEGDATSLVQAAELTSGPIFQEDVQVCQKVGYIMADQLDAL